MSTVQNAQKTAEAKSPDSLDFWQTYLQQPLPLLEVPADQPRLPGQPKEMQTYKQALPAALAERLKAWCAKQEEPLLTVLLTAFHVLLYRYTSMADQLVALSVVHAGTTMADSEEKTQNSLLPVRNRLSPDMSFRACCNLVDQTLAHLAAHATMPLDALLPQLQLPSTREDLCQVAFALDACSLRTADMTLWPAAWDGTLCGCSHKGRSKTEVSLEVELTSHQIELRFHYNARLFSEARMQRMAGHYTMLLQSGLAEPERPIVRLELLPDDERQKIVTGWNQTRVDFPADECLHTLFEHHAAQSPDAVALVFDVQHLTYGELNRRANQLAHYLRRLGVGPDVLVGVHADRSIEMVIGLYAILKAGGAYVPMDPSYPPSRIAFMLEDTRVPVLLTQKHLIPNLPEHQAHVIDLDSIWDTVAPENTANPVVGVTPEHLAYVIYTSGSTGRPKGAVLNHRGRVNNFSDFNRRYEIRPGDRVLGISSLSFDMSAYDIFGTLMAGGTTVLVEPDAVLEPPHWATLMKDQQVTIWHSVPALLEMLVDHYDRHPRLCSQALRLVLLGGDWIPVSLPDRLRAMVRDVHVVSMGGATECSMDSTIYDIVEPSSGWKSIPYGVPMANQLSYVLDERFQPQPVGIPGELYLGGIGVGRGYFNRPRLTAEKFLPNPFSGVPGDRMYRTGDLARYGNDGVLELLGRIDFQVKIRGFRVELGEINSTLAQHPDVKEAVVVAKEMQPGKVGAEKRIVAYIVPQAFTSAEEMQKFEAQQVAEWQSVFDETYHQTPEDTDRAFNPVGWNDSYTGLPFSREEIREWLDQSVERILTLKPRRVLDVACGTGLLLFPIAPHCEAYVGTDIARIGLDSIQKKLAEPGCRLSNVTLYHQPADDFKRFEPASFDCVILSSVLQHFPSATYLLKVLEGALRVVRPGGFIYVGDVYHYGLMRMFYTSVQLYQARPSWSLATLRKRIDKAVEQDEHLYLHPKFFSALPHRYPELSHVHIQLRRGSFPTEMNRYRYDVFLFADGAPASMPECEVLDWQKEKLTVDALQQLLEIRRPGALRIRDIPNARLAKDLFAFEAIASTADDAMTVQRFRAQLDQYRDENGVDPEAIWKLAGRLPYRVAITGSETPGYFDALLCRDLQEADLLRLPFPKAEGAAGSHTGLEAWASQPLRATVRRELGIRLRAHAQRYLPEHMVPSAFVFLDALPLSPNGKIDRRALPAPDFSLHARDDNYLAPRTDLEKVIAATWAEVFEIERIGLNDDFYALGGHSLLAIQIMARLREIFPVELRLSDLFEASTVAGFASRIERICKQAGVDAGAIARLYIQMITLSEEETQQMLAQVSGV